MITPEQARAIAFDPTVVQTMGIHPNPLLNMRHFEHPDAPVSISGTTPVGTNWYVCSVCRTEIPRYPKFNHGDVVLVKKDTPGVSRVGPFQVWGYVGFHNPRPQSELVRDDITYSFRIHGDDDLAVRDDGPVWMYESDLVRAIWDDVLGEWVSPKAMATDLIRRGLERAHTTGSGLCDEVAAEVLEWAREHGVYF